MPETVARAHAVQVGQAPSVKKFCRAQGFTSPAQRLQFFQSSDALQIFSAQVVEDQVRRLLRDRTRLRNVVCSASWFVASFERREQYPPGADDTAMVLSKVKTRWDTEEDGIAHRRWTPPNNVAEEDYIDGLGFKEAAFRALSWPASPSAIAIFRHLTMTKAAINRSLDNGGREGRGRSKANAKRKNGGGA